MGGACESCTQCQETNGPVPFKLSQEKKDEIAQIVGLQLLRSDYVEGQEEGEITGMVPENFEGEVEGQSISQLTQFNMSQLPHEPDEEKMVQIEEMNPINDVVNEVREKLQPVDKIFDLPMDYGPHNPELGPYQLQENMSSYYGGFKRGVFEGYGTQIWEDGSIYEGQFKYDQANGKGRLINEDGGCYIGDFVKAQANGYGEYFNSEGIYYKGEFKENQRDGMGEEEFADGSKYQGEYIAGIKEVNFNVLIKHRVKPVLLRGQTVVFIQELLKKII